MLDRLLIVKVIKTIYILIFLILCVLTFFVFEDILQKIMYFVLGALIIGFLGYTIYTTKLFNQENEIYNVKIDKAKSNEEIEQLIEEIETKLPSYYIESIAQIQRINLIYLYLLLDKKEEAGYYLFSYRYGSLEIRVMYYKILFELYNDHLLEARKIYLKFLRRGNNSFDVQRNNAKALFELIDTREMNYELYDNTSYKLVRDICDKYVRC